MNMRPEDLVSVKKALTAAHGALREAAALLSPREGGAVPSLRAVWAAQDALEAAQDTLQGWR